MNIDQATKEGFKKLSQNKQIKTPILDVEILLSTAIKKSKEYILTFPEKKISSYQKKKYHKLIEKRFLNIPISQITGEKEFYGLPFIVNQNTLSPRPETELIVDEVLKILNNSTPSSKEIFIIDIGTGTGCIPISIAKNADPQRVSKSIYAVDISKKALDVARKNSILNKTNKTVKFLNGNLLEPVLKIKKYRDSKNQTIITANLPYLTPEQFKKSPSIHNEPKLALIAGNNGLKYYKELFQQIKSLKSPRRLTIFCEIDPSQKIPMSKLLKKMLPEYSFEIKKDLAGLDRLFIIKSH